MFRNSLFLVLFFFVHLICDAQTNRDLLFGETWYTAEGLVMTFDSSGVTWEGVKVEDWFFVDDVAVRYQNRTELVDGLTRNVVYANYKVNADSLILEFIYDMGFWFCPPMPRVCLDTECKQSSLVLYSSEHFSKKEPVDNFLSFHINMSYATLEIESNGTINYQAKAHIELADRVIYGVYRGILDSSQLVAFRTELRDSGFFNANSYSCIKASGSGSRTTYTCLTSNYTFVRYDRFDLQSARSTFIHDNLLSSSAWERNGMKYYGMEGDLEEPMEEVILAWKPGMPEEPRLAVAGPIRFIEKVSTLKDTAYIYSVKVDTVYRGKDHDSDHTLDKRELILTSPYPIEIVSRYGGVVLTWKTVQTLTWQSDHTGRPYACTSYYELLETFPTEGVAVRFLRSEWDSVILWRCFRRSYQNWPPSNLASSNFEFKVAKAARQAQGQSNYIRRDWSGKILPLK